MGVRVDEISVEIEVNSIAEQFTFQRQYHKISLCTGTLLGNSMLEYLIKIMTLSLMVVQDSDPALLGRNWQLLRVL